MIKRLCLIFTLVITAAVIAISADAQANAAADKMAFWQTPKRGANIFNNKILREDIKAAKEYGIEFIRLAPDKFTTKNRDFLIGDADKYTVITSDDLKDLLAALDMCREEKMPVVITMISLPGSRWKQNNQGKDDLRIWMDKSYQDQALKFWIDLSSHLKDHPAIIAYNPLNEPHPEKIYGLDNEAAGKLVNEFYQKLVFSIRQIDKNTPIILDSSNYADA
jgi:aryl-phospho-beta-D-glucosidase BglC (GH1 family)